MNLLAIMPLEIKIKGGGPKFTEFACLFYLSIYLFFFWGGGEGGYAWLPGIFCGDGGGGSGEGCIGRYAQSA